MVNIKIVAGIIILVVVGIIGYWYIGFQEAKPPQQATSTPEIVQWDGVPERSVIGTSVEGRPIEAYTYGIGDTHLVLVGTIHGGYEWNTALLAYEAMDYFSGNPDAVPDNMSVTIIPVANPDGLHDVIGTSTRFSMADVPSNVETAPARFNANGVDLNRNFDCNWQPTSTWRGDIVDAGTRAFSEPEAQALKQYFENTNPEAAVFWHSAAEGVYGSECNSGILPGTMTLMNTYANAAGYPAIESFDYYEITGDIEGWLASIGVPAVSVELKTHSTVEWEQNRAGIDALLRHYGK